ncbi:MAG TPA: hypothetical protein VK358_15920 [Longimicrobium sp.]|nr:hypothetical protein [Longimicrobium sp.]
MSEEWTGPCRVCGRRFGENDKPDAAGWCSQCRGRLVSRSTRVAWAPALVFGLLYGYLLVWGGLLESRFMVVWIALGVALAWVVFKVARRVAFDVIRGRMTPRAQG